MAIEKFNISDGSLEVASGVASALNPIVGAIAKTAVGLVKERRLEAEARMRCRLKELSDFYRQLEATRKLQVEDRDLQRKVLVTLIELAKETKSPDIIKQAMACFRDFTQSSTSYTQELLDSLWKIESLLEVFPEDQSVYIINAE